MTTKNEVIAIHNENPLWDASTVARHLNCSPGYVRATGQRNGLVFGKRALNYNDPNALRALALEYIRRATEIERDMEAKK